MMRYAPQTAEVLRTVLNGLDLDMPVVLKSGVTLVAATVADLRALDAWPPDLCLITAKQSLASRERGDRRAGVMLFVELFLDFPICVTEAPSWMTANDLGQKRLNTKSFFSKLSSALGACERLHHDDRLLLLKEIATRLLQRLSNAPSKVQKGSAG